MKKCIAQKEFINEIKQDLENLMPILNNKITLKQAEFVNVLISIVLKHHS